MPSPLWVPGNFLALPQELSDFPTSRAVILPVPYDSTTSYRTGARDGPRAIIEASRYLEDWDPELQQETCRIGIHTLQELEPHLGSPQEMIERIAQAVRGAEPHRKIVCLLGGEHSITTGAVRALAPLYDDLSVLYLDAHADLQNEYMSTPYSHGCTARRVSEMCPLVEVGVRSLSLDEDRFIKEKGIPVFPVEGPLPLGDITSHLSRHVYISIDLDVLDPSIMAAVGNPEPGGLLWQPLLTLLRHVATGRRIVGFDLTELSPSEGPTACAFTAAKLVYRLLGYATIDKAEL